MPVDASDVIRYLREMSESELRSIGRRAQERVLSEHTSARRACQFEGIVEQALHPLAVDSGRELLAG